MRSTVSQNHVPASGGSVCEPGLGHVFLAGVAPLPLGCNHCSKRQKTTFKVQVVDVDYGTGVQTSRVVYYGFNDVNLFEKALERAQSLGIVLRGNDRGEVGDWYIEMRAAGAEAMLPFEEAYGVTRPRV